ncbi:D-glycero-beta-D-manno-heptose 1-phosphate adenylyltransferase [Arthrobacter globiformis]|uniref:D-glycero-beta-D-manno-heptose 1-phosphate adenylyltransferase n=1 Tax=Arthrobacter globiformis TaxID=1665 RepID=UPI00278D3E6F|nr:D-glycero-beta-D-manno-heptose 1-phosphate adenylyltransferase [Arthrobacter globiformis]MDQ0616610.1 D-beta-D-heptose 7-phosphate kinase/D-beta-D-heptose 1-phosphate adenosyltransferase [Arthrobacter globiformis]
MRIAVVGDVLLDVDLSGEATRLCPDAPVPVVDVSEVRRRAGGAGLVARMLAQDGHRVTLVTVLSDDDASLELEGALAGVHVVSGPSGARTPVKTRVRAGRQPVVRVDEGCGRPEVPAATAGMLRALERAEAIVVADYGRGVAANREIRDLLAARAGDIPIVWDPHPSGAAPVPGVAVVTPNLSEAAKAADSGTGTPAAIAAIGTLLLDRWQSQAVLVTMGEQGGTLSQRDTSPLAIPAPPTEVTDPCGAGDRLAASLAVHLAGGCSLRDAAERAINEAAAFLGAGGVASLPDRHRPVWHHSREEDALGLARRVRANGGTVVATGGCFDLLHAGHARTLAAARDLGDCLIVCLNSDESVRRIKGEQRPIVSQQDRAELLLALECVDAVLVFGEDTPEACLETLRPDVWVKGGDYRASELPEAGLVESWGGRCMTVPFHQARSTSVLADALAKVS